MCLKPGTSLTIDSSDETHQVFTDGYPVAVHGITAPDELEKWTFVGGSTMNWGDDCPPINWWAEKEKKIVN